MIYKTSRSIPPVKRVTAGRVFVLPAAFRVSTTVPAAYRVSTISSMTVPLVASRCRSLPHGQHQSAPVSTSQQPATRARAHICQTAGKLMSSAPPHTHKRAVRGLSTRGEADGHKGTGPTGESFRWGVRRLVCATGQK